MREIRCTSSAERDLKYAVADVARPGERQSIDWKEFPQPFFWPQSVRNGCRRRRAPGQAEADFFGVVAAGRSRGVHQPRILLDSLSRPLVAIALFADYADPQGSCCQQLHPSENKNVERPLIGKLTDVASLCRLNHAGVANTVMGGWQVFENRRLLIPSVPRRAEMIEMLTRENIRDFFRRLSVAIEIDQAYVDSLPREWFSAQYDDPMWRAWRKDTCRYIESLISTVEKIPEPAIIELTEIAVTREPAHLGKILLEHLAEVVGGHRCEVELGTADRFIGSVIEQARGRPKRKARREHPQAVILRWLPVIDPLRIAQDPECSYHIAHSQNSN